MQPVEPPANDLSFRPIRPKDRFLVLGAPAIEEPEIDEIVRTMRSGWLGTGPRVAEFEEQFAAYLDMPFAAAVNSCTAALHLSLLACDLHPGDEVITTPMTFCATVNAIIHAGGTPVLVDVNPETMNLDPLALASAITHRTKALLPVHFAGRPCEMDQIEAIAKTHNLRIIEDCAHAIESLWHNRHLGTFGDYACFSFYVTKNIVTGEGGMVLARNGDNIARIKMLALHGMSRDAWKRFSDNGYKHYQVLEVGFKYNMMDLQAAIGIHQLKRVDLYWSRREEIWNKYLDAFIKLPLGLPPAVAPNTKHGYHLFTVLVDQARAGINRDDFVNQMTRHNVGVGVHYLSIPEHPVYQRRFGWRPEDFPCAMNIGRQTVSLPLSARLSESDVSDVIAAVKTILA